MRRAVVIVLMLLAVCLPVGLLAGPSTAVPGDTPSGWKPRPARYGVNVTEDVQVTMSDGAVLRVNVYRPAQAWSRCGTLARTGGPCATVAELGGSTPV